MDYIEIKGYKSIKEARVTFKPINILIGANGSGKSNFISFFVFLSRLYNQNLKEYIALSGGEDKLLHKGQKNTDQISFKMEFSQGRNGYSAIMKLGESGFVFTEENLIYQRDAQDIANYGSEANIKISSLDRANNIRKHLSGLRRYHFHDTSINSPFTQLSSLENDIYYLYGNGMNIPSFLYQIQQQDKIVYNRIVKNIQTIAPYFSDFYFSPDKNNQLRLLWKDKYSDIVFGPNDLSDGTLRFIALTVLFLQPNLPSTILIDEPELGLHPSAISKLAAMIKSAADKGSQIVLATQSTDLISYFSPEDIITVDQINGETRFNRLKTEELQVWIEDYTIDELWKRNIIPTGQTNLGL